MKKQLIAAAVALSPLFASADILYGLYAEIKAGQNDFSGNTSYQTPDNGFNTDESDLSSLSGNFRFEHFVPFVPNVRVALDTYELNSNVTSPNFTFDDQQFLANFHMNAEVTELTGTLYYEFFDNDLISVDAGVSIKHLYSDMMFTDDENQASSSIDAYIPMAYGMVEVGVPTTELFFGAIGETLSVGDHEITSYDVYVGYTLIDVIAADISLKAGYASKVIDIQDVDGFTIDTELKGPYIGMQFHF